MTKRIILPKGLNGKNGLVAAIVAQAVRDAMRGDDYNREDALRYFRGRGGDYKRHLRLMDVPADWVPQDRD